MKSLPLVNKLKFNKHTILGLLVLAAIVGTYFVYQSLASGSDIVNVAAGQVGFREQPDGSNAGPQVNAYLAAAGLGPGQPWCAAFVSWVYQHAGYNIRVGYTGNLPQALGGMWRGKNGAPQPGDIIVFSANGGHAGIVTSSDGTYVYTIEGNYSNSVARVRHPLGQSDIVGWGGPGGGGGGGGSVSSDPLPIGAYTLPGNCHFAGWAFDRSQLANQIPIAIYITFDSNHQRYILGGGWHYANTYRPDVARAYPELNSAANANYHGFDIPYTSLRGQGAFGYEVYGINIGPGGTGRHATLGTGRAQC